MQPVERRAQPGETDAAQPGGEHGEGEQDVDDDRAHSQRSRKCASTKVPGKPSNTSASGSSIKLLWSKAKLIMHQDERRERGGELHRRQPVAAGAATGHQHRHRERRQQRDRRDQPGGHSGHALSRSGGTCASRCITRPSLASRMRST